MGLGRAVGETMIVLMATGNTPLWIGIFWKACVLCLQTIAVERNGSGPILEFCSWLHCFLFVFTFAVNSIAEWVRQRPVPLLSFTVTGWIAKRRYWSGFKSGSPWIWVYRRCGEPSLILGSWIIAVDRLVRVNPISACTSVSMVQLSRA